jgi:flavin reductase (DIM6/NTAB) family NADH-FMN oxidoreductase RutF
VLDPKELRRVMGHFATGVTIITTCDSRGNVYGLTANAITSVSLDPPLLLICIDRKAETFAHFYDSKTFTVNILTDEQQELSSRFAKSGGDMFT